MKATITEDGVLTVRAESDIEAFALQKWLEGDAAGKNPMVLDVWSYRATEFVEKKF